MGIPSYSNYAVLGNNEMYFNEDTETWGPIHSNDGIRFDGLAHGLITSSLDKYIDHTHGASLPEYGVHTHIPPRDEYPPTPVRDRSDVFAAGRAFPVPPIDFGGITADLAKLKDDTIANGIFLTESNEQGYHIKFNSDQTVDITKVTAQSDCQYLHGTWKSYENISSIGEEESFIYNGQNSIGMEMPTNGLIFVQDDFWVDGQINKSRVTLIAAEDPLANMKGNIYINNDLKYSNYDGTGAIGLIASNNISVGLYSEDDLEINASMIAQNGTINRVYDPDRLIYEHNPIDRGN